jgi:hypothetical protein
MRTERDRTERDQKAAWKAAKDIAAIAVEYGPTASPHEAYALMLEELDELKAEVWRKTKHHSASAMRAEAMQVAARALRFAIDIEE